MLARCVSTGLTPTMESTLTIGNTYNVHDVSDDPGGTVYVVTDDTGAKLPVPSCLFQLVLTDPATVAGLAVNFLNRLRDGYSYREVMDEEGLVEQDFNTIICTLSDMAWPKG